MPSPEAAGERQLSDPIGSVWQLKPWWCQPWSILLTGLIVAGASWRLLHLSWLTTGVGLAVGAWWLLFLVLMPAAWQATQSTQAGLPSEDSDPRV